MSLSSNLQMASNAPIAIFCYRRPKHLRNTLQSLMQCEGFQDSPIFVFGDGPRDQTDENLVNATREVAQELLGLRAQYFFCEINRGLSVSIITGIDEVLKIFDRVIVIEDDLVLNELFLKFMNHALDKYAKEEKVFQVSGYMFDPKEQCKEKTALFLPFTTSWGWATWRRAWRQFDPVALGWEELIAEPELRYRFNLGGIYDYASMLERQMKGKCDSWAIRWYWSVFKENGLVLFPPMSLVKNTGFDGSGTHGRGLFNRFGRKQTDAIVMYPEFPEDIVVNPQIFSLVTAEVRLQVGGYVGLFLDKLRRLLKG